jgi:hypothetical protein
MGDLVRKYVALDGYVRRYLPIRGRRTMEETLRAYRPLDSPSFHLILNAAHTLMMTTPTLRRTAEPARRTQVEAHAVRPLSGLRSFQQATGDFLTSLRLPGSTGYAAVVRTVAADLAARLVPAADNAARALRRLGGARSTEARRLLNAWNHLAGQATDTLAQARRSPRPVAEQLMHVELAICLWDAWRHFIEAELAVAPPRPPR